MKNKALLICAAMGGLFFTSASSNAAVIYNNLNAVAQGADSLTDYGPIADSFSNGSTVASLNQVIVKLSGAADSGSVVVKLLADSGSDTPGAYINTIGSVSDSLLTSTLASYTITLATPYTLAANGRYWVQLTSNNSSANWAWSYDITGVGVASEYLANNNGAYANSSSAPYQMEVINSAPEPGTIALLGLAGIGAGLIRKKLLA